MFVGDIKRCFDNPSYGTDDWQLNLLGNIVEVDNRIKHSAFSETHFKTHLVIALQDHYTNGWW